MTIYWAVLSGFCYGLSDTFTRLGVRYASPYVGAILNSISMALTLAVVVWIRGGVQGDLWPAVGWFFLVGAAGLGPGRLLFYISIQRLGVSRAAVLNSITPFVGILIAVIFLGERPTWHILLGALFIVGGVVGLLTDRAVAGIPLKAASFGISAAIVFSLIPVFMRLGMQSLPDPLFASAVSAAAAMIVLFAGYGVIPRKSRWQVEPRAVWFFLTAGVGYGMAFITFYKALTSGTVSFVTPLIYTSPLFAILISRVFIQKLEQVTWRLALGALAVFAGVVVISLSRGF
jgi:drug/metabolite transporter (DMT)-like permease